ncbi:MAG TPA: dihydrolipoyl dehydrogenase [Deltaproteobacteria bacterium]|nr:dihydrolipoyl dehydrogenase [Deltaproteobacteria bacterium]
MREFDIVVIGGGPGGYVAAIRGAQMGAKTAVVERDRVGGTCLNRGCIPTKALYYSARTLTAVKKAQRFGVSVAEASFDMAVAVDRKDEVVKRLVGGVEQLLKGNGVELLRGNGRLDGAGKVVVERDGATETLLAKNVIIATGSEPAEIAAFNMDRENVLTSTEMLDIRKVPESLLVIGAGVMGCEFATIFAKFGSRVTMVELLPAILSTEDRQVVRTVMKSFKAMGVEVLTGVGVEEVEVRDGSVRTVVSGGREITTEKVLVSIGRRFNSGGLGLETAGVETERGRIKVNERMETNVPGIYAIGDVTGGMLLAHTASAEGGVAAANAMGGSAAMSYDAVPAGIFTDPEIASVGLREKTAAEQGMDVKVGRFPYAACGKALAMDETEGFVQVVADPGTDRVLGCTIVGAHATDLIGEVALAVRSGAKVRDITGTIHAHPTLPEVVLEAAEDVHGLAVHKVGRRR